VNRDPEITICIVTHNRPDLLRRVLAGLAECGVPGEGVRTIVVENGGCRDSEDVARQASDLLGVEYLQCDSPAKSAALNVALRHIDRGLVAFIDDDALPAPGWIHAYADAYARYGRGHYFGGPVTPDYDEPPPEWLRRYLPDSAKGFELAAEGLQEKHVSYLGFNWAANVQDLRTCGGFSEYFGPGTDLGGGDETFMQYQLRQARSRAVYVPQARVSHYVPADRCSPTWALRRSHLAAICHGISHAHYQSIHDLPLQRVGATARFVRRRSSWRDLVSLCRLAPAGRYWLRHYLTIGHGYWKGVGRGANDAPLTWQNWASSGLGTAGSGDQCLKPVEMASCELAR
jgi:GT2 family glycosyltransferase